MRLAQATHQVVLSAELKPTVRPEALRQARVAVTPEQKRS